MATNIDDIRSTLNGLIETLKDGEEGFRTSADKLQNRATSEEFRTFAHQRAHFAADLQAQVSRIGGEPATSGSTGGALHRGWINLKTALTGNNDHAILEEAESGEDAAVKNYRDAVSKDLPSDIRAVVETQFSQVLRVHNTVRSLRDASKPMTSTSGGGTPYAY
jgi:uncharacterized protein (TIGR02284 family)